MIRLKTNAIAVFTICFLLIVTFRFINAASTTIVAKDLDGISRTFFSETDANPKVLVFIFILSDCPISNSYAPELKRLRGAFPQIDFYLVYADPDVAVNDARKHSKDYDFGFPGLLDPMHQLVRRSGATQTPEAAVFSSQGKLLYRGRIDDRYVDFGKKRDRPEHRDLENALQLILQNKAPTWPDKPPVGCFIPSKGQTSL